MVISTIQLFSACADAEPGLLPCGVSARRSRGTSGRQSVRVQNGRMANQSLCWDERHRHMLQTPKPPSSRSMSAGITGPLENDMGTPRVPSRSWSHPGRFPDGRWRAFRSPRLPTSRPNRPPTISRFHLGANALELKLDGPLRRRGAIQYSGCVKLHYRVELPGPGFSIKNHARRRASEVPGAARSIPISSDRARKWSNCASRFRKPAHRQTCRKARNISVATITLYAAPAP